MQGRIQDFKLRGGGGTHLKKLRREEGGAKFFGGISCETSRFDAKKIIFFPIAEGGANIFGVLRVKNHDFTPKNHIFSNFKGAHAGCASPWIPPGMVLHLRFLLSINKDEYVTAAYKTVELDTYLDDVPIQHREVQGHESKLFKSYFNTVT